MLISKMEDNKQPPINGLFFFFYLKLTWPYMIILSLDYFDNKVSWLFSYLSGQSFSISFTNPAPLYLKAPKLFAFSVTLHFDPFPSLSLLLCKGNFYSPFRCHLNIMVSHKACINSQSNKCVPRFLLKSLSLVFFF